MTDEQRIAAVVDKLQGIDLDKHYTQKMFVVSTAMIRPETASWLDSNEAVEAMTHAKWGCYGWFLWCTPSTPDWREAHEELYNLMKFVENRGCSYLLLDCDGEELPPECGLPTFKW